MEAQIARWISHIVGGSYIVMALVVLVFISLPEILSGEILSNPFLLKAVGIAFVYILSIYLVATLPKKSVKRRACSWLFSIFFHGALLLYLGVWATWGVSILLAGFAESIILVLSVIGLSILVRSSLKHEST
ncbi:hypothetical protein [uncultured Neptuniibacter sp.]|uniref:hypothetical protein n=1 Tax=uncultured Neptuniibacter sp. TaxID=502143 RepID=UPI0026081439|nr:hypothetical protein [uncultured Neptuniibacter sp.]